ncbi:MAG: DUF4199 domain-containing protein [Cytophagales bacterium]|nr:MAG: DUF4199 domain-containing protein [Cytophagales bacterium]
MNEQPSTFRVALKWGLILGLVLVAYTLALYLTNTVGDTLPSLLAYPIIVVVLVLAMRDFRALNNGFMSYGEGLTVGVVTAAVSSVLSSIFSYFYTNFIDTGATERAIEKIREKYEEMGMSDDQIETSMEMVQKMQNPVWTLVVGVFFYVLMGLIFSLIIAAIMKKEKTDVFE